MIFSIAMGADYSIDLISIETYAPQFIGHNKIFLGSVFSDRVHLLSYLSSTANTRGPFIALYLVLGKKVVLFKFVFVKLCSKYLAYPYSFTYPVLYLVLVKLRSQFVMFLGCKNYSYTFRLCLFSHYSFTIHSAPNWPEQVAMQSSQPAGWTINEQLVVI